MPAVFAIKCQSIAHWPTGFTLSAIPTDAAFFRNDFTTDGAGFTRREFVFCLDSRNEKYCGKQADD